MNDSFGWERLICDYFFPVCVRTLGPYFQSFGFIEEKSKISGVVFRRNDIFVEVSYLPESAPNYSPSLIIGIGSSKYDDTGRTTGLPAWAILSESDEARRYSFWRFSDDEELASVLARLKFEIIEPHIRPFWEDRARLERAIECFD